MFDIKVAYRAACVLIMIRQRYRLHSHIFATDALPILYE